MKRFMISCCAAVAILIAIPTQLNASILWASDSGGGTSTIFNLDAATGAVNSSFAGPGRFADAVEQVGSSLFILDSINNSTVYETDLSGNVLNSFFVGLDSEGLGALNNGNLIIGGGSSGVIRTIDQAGNTISQFNVNPDVFGIDTNGVDEIYGISISGELTTFDLAGNVLGSMNTGLSGTTLGLAYTGSGFFVASANAGTITELDLAGNTVNSYSAPGSFTEGLDWVGATSAVPEPTSLMMWGCLCLAGIGLRRKSK